MQKAAKMRQVTFKGQRINIFPYYPPAVVKRARELLRDKPGVKNGLQYPAKLRISFNGKEHYFTDPRLVNDPKFYDFMLTQLEIFFESKFHQDYFGTRNKLYKATLLELGKQIHQLDKENAQNPSLETYKKFSS